MTGTDVERALLGSIMANPGIIRDVAEIVRADDFTDIRHGVIYTGMCELHNDGRPLDAITLPTHFQEWSVNGLPADEVFTWNVAAYTWASGIDYAQAVRDASVTRSTVNVAKVVLERAGRENPATTVAWAQSELGSIAEHATPTQLETVALETLEKEQLPDYDWVVPNLIERQDRVVLTGTEGAGKSTLMRQLTILSAAGIDPLSFHRIEPAKVLVIDAENTRVQWRRAMEAMVRRSLEAGGDPRRNVQLGFPDRMDLTTARDLGQVHRLLDIHQPDILVIGPLYRLIPRAITNDDDAAPLLSALDSIRSRGVALLMEAHAGHERDAAGNRNPRPRGSAALLGWPEFGFGLRRDPYDETLYELVKWRGSRDATRKWPKTLRRVGGGWPWSPQEWDE